MARRLDRLVDMRVTSGRDTAADGGLTGPTVTGFQIIAEGPAPAYIDAYIVALGADGRAVSGSPSGVWLAGSVIRYAGPGTALGGRAVAIILNRSVVWSANTYSLRYAAPHRNGRDDLASEARPPTTSPYWYSIAIPYGTLSGRAITGGAVLDVSRTIATTVGTTYRAWATVVEQYNSKQEVQVGSRTLERINAVSTWRMRADDRVGPFSTLTEADGTVWDVLGTRRLLDRSSMMDVECQKALER